jgi:hypothetical protein
MGAQKPRRGRGCAFAFEFNVDEWFCVSDMPCNQRCNLGQPGDPIAIARVKFGYVFGCMAAHWALAVGGSVNRVIVNHHKVLSASSVVHGMHIEFDALTSYV